MNISYSLAGKKRWSNPEYRKMMLNARLKGLRYKEKHWHWKGGKPQCSICGNTVKNSKAKLCVKCFKKERKDNALGWVINNFCSDCGIRLPSMYAKKCRKCWAKTVVSPLKGIKKTKPVWNKGKSKYKNDGERKLYWRERYRLAYYKLTPQQRFALSIRTRIRNAFKINSKTSSTESLLGCTMQFFRNYIENKFANGMSWDNYGNKKNQWSLDHIYPISKFDLTKEEEQKKAFHYKNCQPLWAIENFKKSDKILEYYLNFYEMRGGCCDDKIRYAKNSRFSRQALLLWM